MTHTILGLSALLILAALAGCSSSLATGKDLAPAPNPSTGLLFRELTIDGVARRYAIYVPRDYAPKTPMPAIVFLNGSGECGTDGAKHAVVGLGSAAMLQIDKWPFIIVFPQKPDQKSQWIDHDKLVLAALEATRREFAIDPARTYLTGLSQGGAGTWAIGAKHGALFAAIAPVCGYGDPAQLAAPLKDMPVWAFHGEKDDVVPPAQTRNIVAAIESAGGHPKATYFPDANHNSWDAAYRTQDLGAWLLSHRK